MDRNGTKMFLSLLRGAVLVSKCQAMNNKKNSKTMHAWLATYRHYRLHRRTQELRRREGYQSVSLVLAIVKNCLKRLSEVHTTQDQAMAAGPDRRPPTTHRSRSG